MANPDTDQRAHVMSISPVKADQSSRADDVPVMPPPTRGAASRAAAIMLAMLACAVIATFIIAAMLATAHARNLQVINIASGSWMALAWSAEQGMLYPPLRDDAGNFSGTRYMPLQIILHAGLSRFTGEFLLSGRLLGFAATVAWITAMIALARQRGCRLLIACALAACVLASVVGIESMFTIRSDSLALAAQLWALWLVGRRASTGFIAAAALLCTIGFLAKMSAAWAAVGIACWLVLHNRRALLIFVVVGMSSAVMLMLAVNLWSDGRMLSTLFSSADSGWRGWGAVVAWAPGRVSHFITSHTPATWIMLPAALLAILLATARRQLDAAHLACAASAVMLLIMFADAGVGENHLLELAAIAAVVAGDLWRFAARREPVSSSEGDRTVGPRLPWTFAHLLMAFTLVGCIAAGLFIAARLPLLAAIEQQRTGVMSSHVDPAMLTALVQGKVFLSDDPLPAILLDQRPVISDAFMFRAFGEAHPQWHDEIVSRIERREFDLIVLRQKADPDSWWYRELFLGERVMRAIVEHYPRTSQHGHHWMCLPQE